MTLTSLVFSRAEGCIIHPDDPYDCNKSVADSEYISRLQEYHDTVADVHYLLCSRPYLLSKIITQRKVKGYIFKTNTAGYYLDFHKGTTGDRNNAHMYSSNEALAYALGDSSSNKDQPHYTWGGKGYGHWILVYE